MSDPAEDDLLTLDQPFHSVDVLHQNERILHLVNDRKHRQYRIPKGWRVQGVFQDETMLHGLVYNPYIATWFHMWWDTDGRCLTGGCRDGQWDLSW